MKDSPIDTLMELIIISTWSEDKLDVSSDDPNDTGSTW